MDEPLSNLDAKLRVQMRTEVARLQSQLETTTVYVTHDQTEAMTLGDRVAVMRAGVLQQVGTPAELYDDAEEPLRRRLHRLAGDELHAGRDRAAARSKLPIGEVDAGELARSARGDGKVVAGLRPENFEDAERRSATSSASAGSSSRPRSTWSSRSAPTSTPTSTSSPKGSSPTSSPTWSSDRLDETGAADIREGEEQIVARLDPTSKVKRGERRRALGRHREARTCFDPEQQGRAPRDRPPQGRHRQAPPLRSPRRGVEPPRTALLPCRGRQSACASRLSIQRGKRAFDFRRAASTTAMGRATNAASSAYTRPATTSPASPTSASTRCSTAARSRPGSPPARAATSPRCATPASSPRSSTRRSCGRWRATWRSATCATRPPAAAPGRTRSRSGATTAARWRSPTTAT